MTSLVQCVPNFSEGRDPAVAAAIVASVRDKQGARLVDWSADPDHNRMVATWVGSPEAVEHAALDAARAAVALIDVSRHQGVHPRLGAIDVVPFVPLDGISLQECAGMAHRVGEVLASQLGLPVFFYEAASPCGNSLPAVRKGAFRSLSPDLGPRLPHPTAGAVVVGARGPLIAFNVNLAAADTAAARQIAREIRENPNLPGVRALGLALPSRQWTQVSMNITQPSHVSLWTVFSYVQQRAAALGTKVVGSEVIGAIPGASAFGVMGDALQCPLKPGQVLLETWPRE